MKSFWELTVGFTDGAEVSTCLRDDEQILDQVSKIRADMEAKGYKYAWWSVQSSELHYGESEETA